MKQLENIITKVMNFVKYKFSLINTLVVLNGLLIILIIYPFVMQPLSIIYRNIHSNSIS